VNKRRSHNIAGARVETFDIEAKGSFRLEGEQIDGAFTFENAEYILEAKW
jgi:hypothetical protein